MWILQVPIIGEPGAHQDVPIGVADQPPPADVPGLDSIHVPQSWLLGLDAPPLGPTSRERSILQEAWRAIGLLSELDPIGL